MIIGSEMLCSNSDYVHFIQFALMPLKKGKNPSSTSYVKTTAQTGLSCPGGKSTPLSMLLGIGTLKLHTLKDWCFGSVCLLLQQLFSRGTSLSLRLATIYRTCMQTPFYINYRKTKNNKMTSKFWCG